MLKLLTSDDILDATKDVYRASLDLIDGPFEYPKTWHGELPWSFISFDLKAKTWSAPFDAGNSYATYEDCLLEIEKVQTRLMAELLHDMGINVKAPVVEKRIAFHLATSPRRPLQTTARRPTPEQTDKGLNPAPKSEIEEVLAERQGTHGDFSDNARFCETLNCMMPKYPSWQTMSDIQKNALRMIMTKISRILSGDPDHVDDWVDIQGYAGCALKDLRAKAKAHSNKGEGMLTGAPGAGGTS